MQQQAEKPSQRESFSSVYSCKEAIGPMLDRVYTLRYRGYSEQGYISKSGSRKFMDEYDWKANCSSFLLYSGSRAVATLRTCVFEPDAECVVPALDVFRSEILSSVGLNSIFVETNKFVVDPAYQRKGGLELRFHIYKVAVEKALEERAKAFLLAVRPEHVRFYRMLRCYPISNVKSYPGLKFKTVLLASTELAAARDFINLKLDRKVLQHESLSNYCNS